MVSVCRRRNHDTNKLQEQGEQHFRQQMEAEFVDWNAPSQQFGEFASRSLIQRLLDSMSTKRSIPHPRKKQRL